MTNKIMKIVREPITGGQRVTHEKFEASRSFRKNPTSTEAQVWEWIRNRKCLGLKFRRQQIIKGFIVDFYCAEEQIALELDGAAHENTTDYDSERDGILNDIGIRIIRIKNENCSLEKLTGELEKLKCS